jgi:hypothetical protein
MTIRTYSVSDLTRTYDDKTGQTRLDMTAITSTDDFPSFEAVRDHVLNDLRYQRPQADKMETFGWVPTLYMPNSPASARGGMAGQRPTPSRSSALTWTTATRPAP